MILDPSGPKSNSKGGRLMKNFRKVLALILVVATLFSFAAMIGAREVGDYTDYDKVSYQEAVDVLTAIGILDGYTDGSFKPTDSIAREEMAKMVAVLSNAGDDVSELYASACKFADTKDRWSASYVAYCNETGIVAGRNATTFDPRGNVTGIETAKMLLCLIGFDATAQGYVGTNWKTRVLTDAKAIGLLDGFAADYDIAKAITREEAAQMMLNALKAPMVIGTLSDNLVKITNNVWILAVDKDGEWVVGTDITLNDAEKSYNAYVLFGNVVVSDIPVLTNYKGLSVHTGTDCYMNPVTEWTYANAKGTVIWKGQYARTPDYTATVAVDFKTLLKEERESKIHTYSLTAYVDGDPTVSKADIADVAWAYLAALSGKGVLTNVYVNDATHSVVVTFKNTYIGVVTETVKYANTFTVQTAGGNNTYGLNTFTNAGYDFEVGDVILYWVCNADCGAKRNLHDAQICTPVTGNVTMATTVGGDMTKSDATVGGKTYEYAKNFAVTSTMGPNRLIDARETHESESVDLYLDTYGYIMGWVYTDNTPATVYAYAVENSGRAYNFEGDGTGALGFKNYSANLVPFEGTNPTAATTEIDDVFYGRVSHTYDAFNVGRLVSYQVVDDVATNSQAAEWCEVGSYLTAKGTLVDPFGRTVIKGDDTTKYMVRTYDFAKKDYVYTVYTGELPTSYASLATDMRADGTTYSTIQYFTKTVSTQNGRIPVEVLDYVFIDTLFSRVTTHAFILSYEKSIANSDFALIAPDTVADDIDFDVYDVYEAVVDGVKGYLLLTQEPPVALVKNQAALVNLTLQVIGYTYDGMPVYAGLNITDATPTRTFEYQYSNGMIYVGGQAFDVADDIVIAVCIPTSNGQELKVLESVEQLNDYVERYGSAAHIDPTTAYVTVSGWYYDDGAGLDASLTEIYINFGTVLVP